MFNIFAVFLYSINRPVPRLMPRGYNEWGRNVRRHEKDGPVDTIIQWKGNNNDMIPAVIHPPLTFFFPDPSLLPWFTCHPLPSAPFTEYLPSQVIGNQDSFSVIPSLPIPNPWLNQPGAHNFMTHFSQGPKQGW